VEPAAAMESYIQETRAKLETFLAHIPPGYYYEPRGMEVMSLRGVTSNWNCVYYSNPPVTGGQDTHTYPSGPPFMDSTKVLISFIELLTMIQSSTYVMIIISFLKYKQGLIADG
jgi:hypothetical protein